MRTLTIATLLWAMTFQALATSVYYINRTSEAIRVNFVVDTTEPVENGYQYRAPSEQVIILPYERVKVADFNRYYGIVNGATYDYYMHVDRQNGQDGGWVEERDTPIAQLRLVGHGAGTTLSYGYKRLVLKGDYDPYVTEVNRGDGRHAEFGAKAVYTSGFDDVEFVIAEHDIADMEYREHVLQVATYNLWMIPSVSSDIAARAAMMEHNLSGYDVLALQEA
ncbi:phospholipase, partial [Vibrio campbellii]